jgi:hypothetical protein
VRDWDEIERDWKRKERERKAREGKGSSPRHRKPDSPACLVALATSSGGIMVLAAVVARARGVM